MPPTTLNCKNNMEFVVSVVLLLLLTPRWLRLGCPGRRQVFLAPTPKDWLTGNPDLGRDRVGVAHSRARHFMGNTGVCYTACDERMDGPLNLRFPWTPEPTRSVYWTPPWQSFRPRGMAVPKSVPLPTQAGLSIGSLFRYFPSKERNLADADGSLRGRCGTADSQSHCGSGPRHVSRSRPPWKSAWRCSVSTRRQTKILFSQAVGLGIAFEIKRREIQTRFARYIRQFLEEAIEQKPDTPCRYGSHRRSLDGCHLSSGHDLGSIPGNRSGTGSRPVWCPCCCTASSTSLWPLMPNPSDHWAIRAGDTLPIL